MTNNCNDKRDKILSLAKNRGFVFPGSEIYGGLSNTWDYGPLGVELKNNIKKAWWKKFVHESKYNVGLDAAILMNPQTWVASGHVGGFSDPLVDCKECKSRFRADKLIEDELQKEGKEQVVDGWTNEKMMSFLEEHEVKCPNCGKHNFTDIRQFNLMFKTYQGVTEGAKAEIYLRPETAQGIFVNFKSVQRSMRKKLPFGICQIGKSFRNEITPGNFIFRTREFEQMELEFFCAPDESMGWFDFWQNYCVEFLKTIGIKEENIRKREHSEEELSHYSEATTDIEYNFSFGWGELWGIANRTDFDLKQHTKESGEELVYQDSETNQKFTPYCIEPSLGADRLLLAVLNDAYEEEIIDEEKNTSRVVMRLHPYLAPYKAAVLPLSKQLSTVAEPIFENLVKDFAVDYDQTGSIGKRYRRQDEIGTPYCICVDFDTEKDGKVTIRDRDTMEQARVGIDEISAYIGDRVGL